jgi:hypothetical protein
MSAVAGIINSAGEVARVVVGPLSNMGCHVRPGEELVIVRGLEVEEPIPFGQAQVDVIERTKRYVEESKKTCGCCKQCCKTLYINEGGLTKPSHTWCTHACAIGCDRYASRPKPCRVFKCLWLKSQETDAPMPFELRPDKCGVVLTSDTSAAIGLPVNTDLIEVHVDRDTPDALKNIAPFLTGRKTKLITHYHGE